MSHETKFPHNNETSDMIDVCLFFMGGFGIYSLIEGIALTAIICLTFCAVNLLKRQWVKNNPVAVIDETSLTLSTSWFSHEPPIKLGDIQQINTNDEKIVKIILKKNQVCTFNTDNLREEQREAFKQHLQAAVLNHKTG